MSSNQQGTRHILVVEDDDDMRECVVAVLEQQGYVVAAVGDGAQALSYLCSSTVRPDLVLLDLMMPNMNGREFRERQLQMPGLAAIPVAVFSADPDAASIAVSLGVAAFLPKPLDAGKLLEMVGPLLATSPVPVAGEPTLAHPLERLLDAASDSANVDDLLGRVLGILVDLAGADVGVLRLREEDRLRSRAAIGLEAEVASGFSVPVDEALGGSSLTGDSLVCVPLVHADELIAAAYLGTRKAAELPDPTQPLIAAVAARSAAAIKRQLAHDGLERALRARDEVLAVVAHDLRNPLSIIAYAATSLLVRLPDSATRRSVDRIIRSTQRADRLIRDLLEISAIERGWFTVDRKPVDTAHLILTALESQQNLAAEASVILATDLSPDVPVVDADEERLLEVLENLIGNAIKFTSAAGVVTVGAAHRGAELVVWVNDRGSGIPADLIPHIFDRFWQAQKKDRRGMGLGLTICKAIVEAHGGRIWADSTVGAGTTMYFTIPAAAAERRRGDVVVASSVSKILLVDDRPENLISLRAILDQPEYQLITASSGEEALRFALRQKFDLALIDVAMPGMSGFEVAVHLKELERSRNVPIIFITAFGEDPKEIHRAYAAGGADYLVKPLDAEIVRKKVAVFVDLSKKRQASARQEKPSADYT